jgi:mannose-6-phosphate isomerase-like protein (cupin superfamily)
MNPVKPVSRKTAEHYNWGAQCDGWHLVKDAKLSVIEEQMPPGTFEMLHHHGQAQQFFYMLSGEAVMEANGQLIRISTGEGVRIPPGVRHQIKNATNQPIRFLAISEPPSHADRIEDGAQK